LCHIVARAENLLLLFDLDFLWLFELEYDNNISALPLLMYLCHSVLGFDLDICLNCRILPLLV